MFYVYWLYLWEGENIYKSGYVGITNDIVNRFYKHRKRFGEFKFKIIFTGNLDQAYALELHLRPSPNIGWNRAKGGLQFGSHGPMKGLKHSQETIEKIKLSNIGKNKGKSPQLGKRHSDETKEKLRIISSSRKQSDEAKAKVSEALKKRIRKQETFDKISKAASKRYEDKRNNFKFYGQVVALVDADQPGE